MMSDNLSYPGFLESEIEMPPPEEAAFHIIPAPYEKSVSYGTGTESAPSCVLNASQQLELFNGVGVPARAGILTHQPIDCTGTHEEALARIADKVSYVMGMGKIPILIGGEHTVTNGALQAMKNLGEQVGIIQFDAHADLRDTYQGTPYSHACVMRRALDAGFHILQIGVRSLTEEEHILRESEERLHYMDASEVASQGIDDLTIPASFPDSVYITFDVDALDPSVMPATGTPEPGGLDWYHAMSGLRTITAQRKVVGIDAVELAPIPGLHHPDYTVARLLYNCMGFLSRSSFCDANK